MKSFTTDLGANDLLGLSLDEPQLNPARELREFPTAMIRIRDPDHPPAVDTQSHEKTNHSGALISYLFGAHSVLRSKDQVRLGPNSVCERFRIDTA